MSGGTVSLLAPRAYQLVGGAMRVVPSRYVVSGRTAHLRLGGYDRGLPLVIDPKLAYSSYLGGSQDDDATAIAVDPSGAAYIAGYFGTGAGDAWITKLAPDGEGAVFFDAPRRSELRRRHRDRGRLDRHRIRHR